VASRGRRDHHRSPSPRTAELLGLDPCRAALPAASQVKLTYHAVERFRERIAPEMTIGEARRTLTALKAGARVLRDRPAWAGRTAWERQFTTTGYIVITSTPACVLPIEARDGMFLATTCLAGTR
jgi:hypothetical protein